MGILQLFFTAMVVGFSGAIVPGPMFTLVVTKVSQKGFISSIFIVLGHAIAEFIVLILFLFGLVKYLNNELIVRIIGITGGVMLIVLSFNLIYSNIKYKLNLSLDVDKNDSLLNKSNLESISNNSFKVNKKNNNIAILQGIFVSMMNPYWYIWWVTIGASFFLKSIEYGKVGSFFFFSGHISSDFIWYLFVGFIISKGKKVLNQKFYKIIIFICGVFLFYLGIKFIIDFIGG